MEEESACVPALAPIVKVTERRPARPVASGAAEPAFLRSPDIPEADPSRDPRVSGEVSSDWAEPPPECCSRSPGRLRGRLPWRRSH